MTNITKYKPYSNWKSYKIIKKEYMKNEFAINNKAKAMALILRSYFPNSAGARWEKYITW